MALWWPKLWAVWIKKCFPNVSQLAKKKISLRKLEVYTVTTDSKLNTKMSCYFLLLCHINRTIIILPLLIISGGVAGHCSCTGLAKNNSWAAKPIIQGWKVSIWLSCGWFMSYSPLITWPGMIYALCNPNMNTVQAKLSHAITLQKQY